MNKILVLACIALSLALFYFKRKHDQCRRELEKQKRLVKSLTEGIELEPSPAEEPSQLMNLATTAITPLISFIGPNLLKKKNDFLKETIDTSDYELSQQMRQLDEIEEENEPAPPPKPAAPKLVSMPAAPKPMPAAAARPTPPRPASPPPMVPPEVLLAALWSRQAEALAAASPPPRTSKITEIFDDPPAVAAPQPAPLPEPLPEPLPVVNEPDDIVSQLADAVADDEQRDLPELSDTRDVTGLPDALKREADAIDEEIRQFTHDNEDEVVTVEKPLAAQQAKKNKKRKPLYKHPALQPDFFCQDGVCSIKPK